MLTCVGLLISVARQVRVEQDMADEPVGEAQTA
jgi:hypothetical protein